MRSSFSIPISLLAILLRFSSASPARAIFAAQELNSRATYQGGWPLALAGSASTTCPVEASVKCSSTLINPSCCPAGQICIRGPYQDANYCCPSADDCNTAVMNFPRCANETWIMYYNYPAGYFCCETGEIGVNPSSGSTGGLCEPADQAVPTSLLATIMAQVGATATPTGAGNSTMTGGGGTAVTGTSVVNPSATSSATNTGFHFTTGKSVSIAIAAVVVIVFISVVYGCIRRRRNNQMGMYAPTQQYDLNGEPIYRSSVPYVPPASGNVNNVTVHVVNGSENGRLGGVAY